MLNSYIRESLNQSVHSVCNTLGVAYSSGFIPIQQPASLGAW
jgi:hypothetical protein